MRSRKTTKQSTDERGLVYHGVKVMNSGGLLKDQTPSAAEEIRILDLRPVTPDATVWTV
jgi:hypothetical protein